MRTSGDFDRVTRHFDSLEYLVEDFTGICSRCQGDGLDGFMGEGKNYPCESCNGTGKRGTTNDPMERRKIEENFRRWHPEFDVASYVANAKLKFDREAFEIMTENKTPYVFKKQSATIPTKKAIPLASTKETKKKTVKTRPIRGIMDDIIGRK